MATAIKICGITRHSDAMAAAHAGAHAAGFVFCAKSPRNVSIATARELASALPPFVTAVGLFVHPAAADGRDIFNEVPLNPVQLYREWTPEPSGRAWRAVLKAAPDRGGRPFVTKPHA